MENIIRTSSSANRGHSKPSWIRFVFYLLMTGLFCFAAATPANASTYYLDALNGDDSNPGTSDEPWQTLAKAQSVVVGGDTVIMRDGEYGDYHEIGINRSDWITYQVEDGHSPELTRIQIDNQNQMYNVYLKFDGFTIRPDVDDSSALMARSSNYITFENLDVIGQGAAVTDYGCRIWDHSTHITVNNCTFSGGEDTGRFDGFTHVIHAYNNDHTYIVITNNEMKQFWRYGVYIHCGTGNIVSGNHIHTIGGDGIYFMSGDGLTIEDNEIHDIERYEPDLSETPTDTTWSEDGTTMTNNSATWGVDEPFPWPTYIEIYVNSGNNVKTGDNEVRVQEVVGPTQIIFDKSIKLDSDGPAPSNVDYILRDQVHADLIQAGAGNNAYFDNVTIRRNKLYDIGPGGWSFMHIQTADWLNTPTLIGGHNFLIENNLCWNSYEDGQNEYDHPLNANFIDGLVFRNNIVIGRVQIKSAKNVTFTNNIVGYIQVYSNAELVDNDYNIINRGTFDGEYSAGASTTFLNPGYSWDKWNAPAFTSIFADYANGDFRHASANSLGVGHGDPENSPISDILGVSRVFPPDAGCYEFPVDPNNQAPVLQEIGDKSVNENSVLIFGVTATDANGDDVANITYSIQNKPSGATFVNRTFSWTPSHDQAETYTVTFIASDGQAQDSETITITVNNVNRAPELNTIGDQSVNENSTLSFSVSASDADGDTISYSLNTLPGGAVFGSETFTWTPGYDRAETYTLTFIASDGQAQDSETITITVSNVNRKPVLADIGNQSVYTTRTLGFAVSASDLDGDAIDYSASGTPSGASFTNQTFSWTPDAGQNGTYQVTFAASDGQLQDAETITIEVGADDSSPVVANCSPTDGAAQVPLNNLIILHILDDNSGVDVNSVTIKVNDDVVYTGNTTDYSSAWGHCRRTGTIADFTFVYQADQMFDFDQAINVTVNAADICGNAMVEHSHSFETGMFSFGENKNINADGLSKNYPATVQDSGGNIWAAWHAGATGSRDIYIAKLAAGAGSFAGSIRLTNGAADQCNPAVAIDADDKLYVLWQDNTQGNWDILIRTSADGAAWSAERTVTDSNGNQTNPAIVVDGSLSRNVSVAWQDDQAGNADIYVAVSGNDFVTKTTSQITSHTTNQSEPAITADASNTIYVVWTDQRNGLNDIYGASSSIGPWTEVAVVTKSNSQSSPAIAAEQTGSILHLLWADDISGDSDIYYASSDGLPGSPLTGADIVDDTTGADQSQPAIVVTGSTGSSLKVFASWKDERNVSSNGDTDLYLVQIGSDENVFVGDDGTNSNQSKPALGVDAYGYPYLLWADSRTASPSIYYAATTFVQSAALASNDVSASSGATVGADPAAISSADDVSVIVPAGACCSDLKITISKVENPPKFNLQRLSIPYDFGPSGIEFSQPVTITIPYTVPADGQYASAYWYNPLTGTLSQQGITNVSSTQISPTLYALSFKTTHFSQFIVGGGIVGSDGVSGGGGCSMSPSGQADLKEYLLPYIALAAVMLVLKLRDARRRRLQSTIRGGR